LAALAGHCQALLRSAAGDSIRMTETVEALEAVPEPLRRQLCGLLGLFTAPELWAPGTAGDDGPWGRAGARCQG